MAASLAPALAKVEGPEFDRIVGFTLPPRRHAPVDDEVRAAFEGFDQRHFQRLVRLLSGRHRSDPTIAEDALQETLLRLLERHPDRFREDPESWLGLLYSLARYKLIEIQVGDGRTGSTDALREAAGEAALATARPCVPPSLESDEDSRYAPRPRRGEVWSGTQVLGALQRFRDYHGWPPKAAHCRSIHGLPGIATVNRHFGSLHDAILAAGMVPDTLGRRRGPWGPVEAARACRSFRRRNGHWPGWSDVRRSAGHLPAESTMVRFFGGTKPGEVQRGVEAILS
jgi:DNA-directed RNA polymerase specialized sigma24 family protein